MRVTDTLFYTTTINDYNRSMKSIYDINQQMSSGQNIQNSYEDTGIYVDTMRLDSEINILEQVKKSSSKAQTFAQNTDSVLNQFSLDLDKFKTKLIQASTETNSASSLEAIANELEALKTHMITLGNTSINGQFLFSGSDVNTKPLSNDGIYNGNDQQLKTIVGSGVQLPYNIDGETLFLGRDGEYNKIVSTNVRMLDKTELAETGKELYLTVDNTVADLVGDDGNDITISGDAVFYLSGKNGSGDTFNTKIVMSNSDKVSELLEKIGQAYGNTSSVSVVDVALNKYGQIEVKDSIKGNSLLEMNLFGAVDRDVAVAGTTEDADIANILPATTDVDNLLTSADVEIIEFNKSGFVFPSGVNEAMAGGRVMFEKDGNILKGNASQIVTATNTFANSSTKLIETAGTASLDGKVLELSFADRLGNAKTGRVNLLDAGSTFQIDYNNDGYYLDANETAIDIFGADGNATPAYEMTYQQLSDIVSIAISNTVPAGNTVADYNTAITDANRYITVGLDYRGTMVIEDKNATSTLASFSLYDTDSTTYDGATSSAFSFMSSDSVAIQDPYIDFFKDLDDMIEAVRNGNYRMDGDFDDPRNKGMQNALSRIDQLMSHVVKEHTKIGAYSNSLLAANDRATLLSVNVQTVRSEIADVDVAEAYMKFTQLSNNYQAMLSTIAKINSMSLLNYM
ncbi:MAG: flagellin [Sulfurospirillaceae bacterium]|nr:flagellin [Sulfurospirillaceae bacterium]